MDPRDNVFARGGRRACWAADGSGVCAPTIKIRASPPPANRGLLDTANTASPHADLCCLDKRFCDKIKGPPQLGFRISIFL